MARVTIYLERQDYFESEMISFFIWETMAKQS